MDFDARLSDIVPTVVTVSWTTDVPVPTWVEYGLTDDFERGRRVSSSTTTEHEVQLLGLTPESDWRYRLGIEVDGEPIYMNPRHISTGLLPVQIPALTLELPLAEPVNEGFTLTTVLTGTSNVIAVLDDDGNYVWWVIDETPGFWSSRARFAPDGSGIFYNRDWSGSIDAPKESSIVQVSWTGEVMKEIVVPNHHHDFLLHEDGTIATITDEKRTSDGVETIAGGITEIATDGSQTEIWWAWDDLEPPPDLENGQDWTHFNAISYLPDEDAYLVGEYRLSTFYKVDATTGEIEWTMGRSSSDWSMPNQEDQWFSGQHQFELLEDSFIVFDNRAKVGEEARVVEYAMDSERGELTQIWEYRPDPGLVCNVLGDVKRMDNGNTLVTWSSAGLITELTPEGETVWELSLELGAIFGYLERVDSLGVQ